MKILVASPPLRGTLGVSLAAGFVAAGHDGLVAPATSLCAGNRALVMARRHGIESPLSYALAQRLARMARQHEADVLLVVKGRFLRAADVRRLGSSGRVMVNYFPDDPFHPDHYADELVGALRAYDLVLIWSEHLAQRLEEHGVRTAVVPFGYDPTDYSPRPANHPQLFDVALVGQWLPEREAWLRQLHGLRLAVSGLGWKRALQDTTLEGAVLPGQHFGRDAARVYWSAAVGLNALHPQNRHAHNMRTWELPATATATVASRTPDHEQLYGNGAVLVDGLDDVRPAVERLLADSEWRARMAATGRGAVADGTYERRAREIVELIEAL